MVQKITSRKVRNRSAGTVLVVRVFLALVIGIVFVLLVAVIWRKKGAERRPQETTQVQEKVVRPVPRKVQMPFRSGEGVSSRQFPPHPQVTRPSVEREFQVAREPESNPGQPAGNQVKEIRELEVSKQKGAVPSLESAPRQRPSSPGMRGKEEAEHDGGGKPILAVTSEDRHRVQPGGAQPSVSTLKEKPGPKRPRLIRSRRVFLVQAGAFKVKSNALELAKRLKKEGFACRIVQLHHRRMGLMYLVQLLPFATVDDAQRAARRVKKREGIQPWVFSRSSDFPGEKTTFFP